ncbi:hypothetical protein GY45DRAFT_192893 [Cubamyces sp. BRFM 1775]|nr:hypothetical protein GY45DRAFT_192893 [Cubamyces sp. BRFM 1775]
MTKPRKPSRHRTCNHVLHVNITTASPDSPWLLDYLIIATNPSPAQVSISPIDIPLSTASPSNTGNTTTASSSSHTSKPTTNVSRPDPSDTSSLSSFPLAPVIGGAAGGIVLVAALLALLFYLWKRWRKPTLEQAVVGSNRQSRGDEPRLPQVTLPRSDPGRVAPRIHHREESVSSRVSTPPLASGSMTRPSMVAAYPSGSGSSYAGQQGWSQHGQPTEWARQQAVYPPVSMASTSYSGSAQWQQGGVHAQRNWGQPDYPTMPSPASGFGPGYSPPHPAIYPHPHLASNPITSADRGYFSAPLTRDVDPSFHTGSAEHTSYPPNPEFAPSIAERPHGMLPHARSTSSLMDRASTASPIPVASHAAIAAELPGSRTVTPFSQASQAPHPSTGVVPPGPTYDATAAPIHHSAEDSLAHRMASVADSSSGGTTVSMLGGVMEFDGKESRLVSDRGVNRAEVDGDVDSTSKDSSEDGQRRVTAPPAYSP